MVLSILEYTIEITTLTQYIEMWEINLPRCIPSPSNQTDITMTHNCLAKVINAVVCITISAVSFEGEDF